MESEKLTKLKAQQAKIAARIQKQISKETQQARKDRNAQLMRWGIVVSKMLETGTMKKDYWVGECKKHLTRQADLDRALAGLVTPAATAAAPLSTDGDTL